MHQLVDSYGTVPRDSPEDAFQNRGGVPKKMSQRQGAWRAQYLKENDGVVVRSVLLLLSHLIVVLFHQSYE